MTAPHHWRFSWAAAACAMAVAVLPLAHRSAAAGERTIVVKLDLAKVVKLPAHVQTLILGNPIIADVTLLRGSNTMVITGRGYGTTNLIMLDHSGNPVGEQMIRVEQDSAPLVIVQRGMDRESYSCSPRCQPTVELGDNAGFTSGWASAIQTRNGLALGQVQSAPASGPSGGASAR